MIFRGKHAMKLWAGPLLLANAGIFTLTLCGGVLAQGGPMQLGQKPGATSATKTTPQSIPIETDPAVIVKRANAYFNGMNTLVADFVQSGADNRSVGGKLYLQRPGKLRFEYAHPSPLEIIADGTSLAIRNRKLNTQDVYFINQTPLKFLLKSNLDLAKDLRILNVSADPETTSIRAEDKTTLGGASRITLIFNTADFTLSRWVVTDPQGNDTRVQLSELDLRQRLDRSLFVINTERFDNP